MDHLKPEDVPPELLAQFQQYEEFEGLERGRLVRVVAIGQTVEASDVRVELIALEIREAGAFLYWRAFTGKERFLGDIQLEISDGLGTAFRTMSRESGGDGRDWGGRVAVMPAPPDPSQVRVSVRGFDAPFDHYPPTPRTAVTDRWEFDLEWGANPRSVLT